MFPAAATAVAASTAKTNAGKLLAFTGLVMACLMTLTSLAFGQTSEFPQNAHAKSYGEGWECDTGYRIAAELCERIEVPANAYVTGHTYGTGWECRRGFKEVDDKSCAAIFVPENAYLDTSGRRWECLRGYTRESNGCAEIVVPENAYLSDEAFGSDWTCERGFSKTSTGCAAIVVPENAFLNGSGFGTPWTCERRFVETQGGCAPVIVPENGYFYEASYGAGWKCARGFEAQDDTCLAIEIPENAHLDRSGNRWECDTSFQTSKGQCVFRN